MVYGPAVFLNGWLYCPLPAVRKFYIVLFAHLWLSLYIYENLPVSLDLSGVKLFGEILIPFYNMFEHITHVLKGEAQLPCICQDIGK